MVIMKLPPTVHPIAFTRQAAARKAGARSRDGSNVRCSNVATIVERTSRFSARNGQDLGPLLGPLRLPERVEMVKPPTPRDWALASATRTDRPGGGARYQRAWRRERPFGIDIASAKSVPCRRVAEKLARNARTTPHRRCRRSVTIPLLRLHRRSQFRRLAVDGDRTQPAQRGSTCGTSTSARLARPLNSTRASS